MNRKDFATFACLTLDHRKIVRNFTGDWNEQKKSMLHNNFHHNKGFISGMKLFMDEKQVIHANGSDTSQRPRI